MARPEKEIPLEDIKGLKTLIKKLDKGEITQEEIANYYSKKMNIKVSQETISRKIKKYRESEK